MNLQDVRSFWEANPLSAASIPYPIGSPEFLDRYDQLRELNESPAFSAWLHEYDRFTGKKVLDIGCGNGYVLSRYVLQGAKVYGVDLTVRAIQVCRQRFEYMNLQGNFQEANAEKLPFDDAEFDCVCSMGVLHHVPNTAQAVAEIQRVLKPGGRLIVMMYYRNSLLYRWRFQILKLLTGKSMQQLVNEVDGVGNPKGDVYTKDELRHLLQGFDQFEMFVGLLQGWMILPWIGRFIPDKLLKPFETRWGWFLYTKAVKPA